MQYRGDDIVYTYGNMRKCASYPGAEEGSKGWAVRPLKRHVSWVQNVNIVAFYTSNGVQ